MLQAKDIMPVTKDDLFVVYLPAEFIPDIRREQNELSVYFREHGYALSSRADVVGCELIPIDGADAIIVGRNGIGFLPNVIAGDLATLIIQNFRPLVGLNDR